MKHISMIQVSINTTLRIACVYLKGGNFYISMYMLRNVNVRMYFLRKQKQHKT